MADNKTPLMPIDDFYSVDNKKIPIPTFFSTDASTPYITPMATSCNDSCDFGCMDGCEVTCTSSCISGCCTSACQGTCQGCTSGCILSCTATCTASCTSSCTACQDSCISGCTSTCTAACTTGCQTGSSCQSACTSCTASCISTCEASCQTCTAGTCQSCTSGCTNACITTCELSCQSCQVPCTVCTTTQTPIVNAPTLTFVSQTYVAANNSWTIVLHIEPPATGLWTTMEIHAYLQSGSDPVYRQTGITSAGNITFSNFTSMKTYVFYAQSFYVDATQKTWSSGYSSGVTVTCSGRPANFAWGITIQKGQKFYFPATEWTAFTARINEFRRYKSLTDFTFTAVDINDKFFYSIFNEAVTAISQMSPPTSPPSQVATGDKVSEVRLSGLVTSLNSIV